MKLWMRGEGDRLETKAESDVMDFQCGVTREVLVGPFHVIHVTGVRMNLRSKV